MADLPRTSHDDQRLKPSVKSEPRKQLSMVLPPELLVAIKERARELSLTVTAYVVQLVRHDLGGGGLVGNNTQQRLDQIEQRLQTLENQDQDL